MVESDQQGQRLDQVRKSLNYSQVKFASLLGITQGFLNQVLKGRRNISYNILQAITKHLPEVSTEWILTGRGDPFKNSAGFLNEPVSESGKPRPIALDDLTRIIISIQDENTELRARIEALEEWIRLHEHRCTGGKPLKLPE